MHVNPHLHLNTDLSAGFLTGQFSTNSGSKRTFFCDETSHGDLVEALFSRTGSPKARKLPRTVGEEKCNTIKIHHVASMTSIPEKKKKLQWQQKSVCALVCDRG